MIFFAIAGAILLIPLFLILGDLGREKSFRDYPDEIQTAAFRIINMPRPRPSYLGGRLDQIQDMKNRVTTARKQAEGLPDGELKSCMKAYLDYYEFRKIPKDLQELTERTSLKRLNDYKAKQKIKRAKVETILKALD